MKQQYIKNLDIGDTLELWDSHLQLMRRCRVILPDMRHLNDSSWEGLQPIECPWGKAGSHLVIDLDRYELLWVN